MNLHQTVNGAVAAINPMVAVTVKQSTGYTTAADGSQVPTYQTISTQAQIQALSGGDLKKMEGLNVQNVSQKAYLNGNYEGVFRVLGKGGDLLIFGGRTYLVVAVLERWPDWCCVALSMQLDS